MLDKRGVLAAATSTRPVSLELGVGSHKRDERAIGVDLRDHEGVDVVGDALEVLQSLPDSSVASIDSSHFLEHVEDLGALLREAARVMGPGGRFRAAVPHFSNPYYSSDPTHARPFGLYTFGYLVARAPGRRQVPQYAVPLPFEVTRVDLVFRSPFRVRNIVKRTIGLLFNSCMGMREFYEENLCWLFPCYEVVFDLRRL
jgi:SAM-dependent methyltransferase